MSAEESRICRTCGATMAPHEFCPVCAFRGALESDKTAIESAAGLVLERRVGNYEILKREDGSLFELGRGAMGITYKALDVDLRRFAESLAAFCANHWRERPGQELFSPGRSSSLINAARHS